MAAMYPRLWFTSKISSIEDAQEQACWCGFCSNHANAESLYKRYEDTGLLLQHGQKITKEQVRKAFQIISQRFEELSNPAPLEALAGTRVIKLCPRPHDMKTLPLPKPIIDNLIWREYDLTVKAHQFERNRYFNTVRMMFLPMTLKVHVGEYLVTEWQHPHPF